MMSKFIIFILVLFSAAAKAGDGLAVARTGGDHSGGGNLRVCFDSNAAAEAVLSGNGEIPDESFAHIQSIEALDLYDAQRPRGFDQVEIPLVEMQEGEKFIHYVDRILARVEQNLPRLSERLKTHRDQLKKSENIKFYDTSLKRVHDEATVSRVEEGNCVLATAAVQEKKGNLWLLSLDRRLFFHNRHSEMSRAVLILHEIVYALARELGQKDSSNTRILVGHLIANDPETKVYALAQVIRSLGFSRYKERTDFETSLYLSLTETNPIHDLALEIFSLRMKTYASFQDFTEGRINYSRKFKNIYAIKEQTRVILSELKTEAVVSTLSEALANLEKYQYLFEKLKDPKSAEALLVETKAFVDARSEHVVGLMNHWYDTEWRTTLASFRHLTTDQSRAMDMAARLVVDRLIRLAKEPITHEEYNRRIQAFEESPSFVLASDVGVYIFEDLSVYGLGEKFTVKRAKAQRWIMNNIVRAISLSDLNENEISFPTM